MTEFEQLANNIISDAEVSDMSIEGQIEQGLSPAQIMEFLSEIESEDNDLASAELEFASHIDVENEDCDKSIITEANFIKQDYIDGHNNKWFDEVENKKLLEESEEYQYKQPKDESTSLNSVSNAIDRAEKIKNAVARSIYTRKLRRIEINRMAFDQDVIKLADTFKLEHKRLLIKLLTDKYSILVRKYESYIVNRITRILAPAIPMSVRISYKKWPWIFVQNPGFMYKTHNNVFQNYGDQKTFWVDTKLPYFFKQGTEQEILEERCAELQEYIIPRLDRAVIMYYKAKDMMAKRQVEYAARLLKLDGTTVSMGMKRPRGSENSYYSLLQLDPFWFEILYNELKKQRNDELL